MERTTRAVKPGLSALCASCVTKVCTSNASMGWPRTQLPSDSKSGPRTIHIGLYPHESIGMCYMNAGKTRLHLRYNLLCSECMIRFKFFQLDAPDRTHGLLCYWLNTNTICPITLLHAIGAGSNCYTYDYLLDCSCRPTQRAAVLVSINRL